MSTEIVFEQLELNDIVFREGREEAPLKEESDIWRVNDHRALEPGSLGEQGFRQGVINITKQLSGIQNEKGP
jgi:hypothetical protein